MRGAGVVGTRVGRPLGALPRPTWRHHSRHSHRVERGGARRATVAAQQALADGIPLAPGSPGAQAAAGGHGGRRAAGRAVGGGAAPHTAHSRPPRARPRHPRHRTMCRVPVAAAAPAFAPPAWIDDAAATLPPDFTLVAPADLPPIDADDLSMLDAFLGSKIEAGVKAEPAPAGGGAATDALLASYGLGALGGPLTHAVAAGGLPEAVYGPRRKGKKVRVGLGWAARWARRTRGRGAGCARSRARWSPPDGSMDAAPNVWPASASGRALKGLHEGIVCRASSWARPAQPPPSAPSDRRRSGSLYRARQEAAPVRPETGAAAVGRGAARRRCRGAVPPRNDALPPAARPQRVRPALPRAQGDVRQGHGGRERGVEGRADAYARRRRRPGRPLRRPASPHLRRPAAAVRAAAVGLCGRLVCRFGRRGRRRQLCLRWESGGGRDTPLRWPPPSTARQKMGNEREGARAGPTFIRWVDTTTITGPARRPRRL